MSSQVQIIPCCSIHPDRINVYTTVDYGINVPSRSTYSHLPEVRKDTFGRISVQSSRKLSRAAAYLVHMASPKDIAGQQKGRYYKFRLSVVTLTLSSKQIHPDNIIKAFFLNHFLVEAKKRWNVTRYVWKAEKQKNGNIHFHILLDKFIPWSELRDSWNRIQNKLGYVSRYRENLTAWHAGGFNPRFELAKNWPLKKQMQAYNYGVKSDWNNPNSTDIHSLRHVRNVKNYMIKYMVKNELESSRFIRVKFLQACLDESTPLSDEMLNEFDELQQYFTQGRTWGCSTDLSDIKGGQSEIDSFISAEFDKIKSSSQSRIYTGTYYTIYFIDSNILEQLECNTLLSIFNNYLYNHFNYSSQLRINTG